MPDDQSSREILAPGNYKIASFDLDTTGRRLVDEICQIGCHSLNSQKEESPFTQYVIPHRNPNKAARRAYGICVVNIGRYRMLRDINTGEILKTKSEISALQDFLVWLEKVKEHSDGVILVSHEQEKAILVPLLIQAFQRYDLMPQFCKLVKGFCNSANVISKLGNKDEITSLSLRSLCKTVLRNTTIPTTSAVDRCKCVYEILSRVTGDKMEEVVTFTNAVDKEVDNLAQLQKIELLQSTMRPIFVNLMKEGWQVRERMLKIRRAIALQDIQYKTLQESMKKGELDLLLSKVVLEEGDKQEMMDVINNHFNVLTSREESAGKTANEKAPENSVAPKSEPVSKP